MRKIVLIPGINPLGVLKIIFDRIPEMKSWGKLLGDEVPVRYRGQSRGPIKIVKAMSRGPKGE